MELKKIIGWILLVFGLIIIFWTLYSSCNIFTAKVSAPEIFKMEEEERIRPEESKVIPSSLEEPQEEMERIIKEQIKNIIPSGSLAKLLNLISWSIFAGILVFGGSRISGLGIRLIRK